MSYYDLNVDFSDGYSAPKNPDTTFLSPIGFRLLVDSLRYPNAQFNVQAASVPEISAGTADFSTPQLNITFPGDKVEYSDLSIRFLIDEGLVNYQEIHDWIVGMVIEPQSAVETKTRDLTLLILNSHNNVARRIEFMSAYPISLSSLDFDASNTDIQYMVGEVTFKYSYFKIV